MRTTGQHLADMILGQPVEHWIAERRQRTPKLSWRRIALELRDVTDGKVDVAPATLIAWGSAAEPVAS